VTATKTTTHLQDDHNARLNALQERRRHLLDVLRATGCTHTNTHIGMSTYAHRSETGLSATSARRPARNRMYTYEHTHTHRHQMSVVTKHLETEACQHMHTGVSATPA
jgi:hypothetical protein